MAMYEAGAVGINIYPDTTGFGFELRRKLARYEDDGITIPLNIDVDDASWNRAKQRIDGDRIVKTVEVRGDTSALRKAVQDVNERDISPKLDLTKQLRDLRSLRQRAEAANRSFQQFNRTVDTNSARFKNNRRLVERYGESMDRASRLTRQYGDKQIDVLDKTKRRIRSLQDAILKFKPLGSNVVEMREANLAISGIRSEIKRLEDNPAAKIRIDIDRYAKVISDLETVARDTDELNRKEARIRFYTDGADKLRRELDDLRRRYVNLPKEIEAAYRNAIERMNTAGQLAGQDEDFKYTANLDLDVTEARRQAKDFQDEHDKLEMDLDLKSAAASAHLLYLTRPRSVEIYAKLHATDLGKLIDGMTYGATGLRGVNNQFQRLVNLFDTLDTKVPVLGVLGTVLAGVSAGAVNLSSSALGVASSLMAISKAAFAAPAAITGLGAAFVVLRHAWGDKGETFSSQIDIATTKLAGFGDAMDEAFYGKARPAIRGLMDDVSGTLIPGMTGVADSEGRVVAGLADIVRESDKAGELPVIFSRTSEAVDNLNPGLQSAAQAFLRLSDASSQYLPRAASYFSDMAAKFADWVDETRATGEIVASMRDASEQAGYLKDSVKSVWGIATGLYSALAENQNGLEGFSKAVGNADRAVNSAKFQATLKAWADGADDAKNRMRGAFSDVGSAAYELRGTVAGTFRDAGSTISSFTRNVSRLLKTSKTGIGDFSSGVSEGFQQLFDAVGDTGPMFSQLLTTVGQLSRTFGGTLASTLKAGAPLITAVAKAAETTAKAFSMLPEPIQAAIGLYATFGKAGMSAWNTLKTGLVENTMRTLQYRQALNQLGVTSKGAGASMRDAVSGFVAANPALSNIVGNVRNASGVFGKFSAFAKSAGSAVLEAFGGPVGAAVTAGVAVVTAAYAEYAKTAQANEQASENVRSALESIPDSAKAAADGIGEVGKAIEENFNDKDFSGTSFDWLSDAETGFNSVADAAKKLGMNTKELANIATGSQAEYQSMIDKLNESISKNAVVTDQGVVTAGNLAGASMKVRDALAKTREEYINNSEEISIANGHAAGFAKKLIELGEDSDSVSIAIANQATRTEMLAKAQQIAADYTEQQRTAQQRLLNAASDYGETYSNMGDAISRVNQMVADGQQLWDASGTSIQGVSGSFNVLSEAGREAQAALENLGTSGHELLQSMVESGASTDQVKAKQQELARQFLSTADSMHIPAEAATALQEIYGLTPSEVTTLFKAQTEQTKTALTEYLSNIRAIFPDAGNTAVFQTILQGINTGAITSMDQVMGKFTELKNGISPDGSGQYTIVLAANGEQAIVTTDLVKQHADLFKQGDDGTGYTTTLNATDLTKATLDYVNGNMKAYDALAPVADLNAHDNSGPAKASADANANNWASQHPTASFNGDASGASSARGAASAEGSRWDSAIYQAHFTASSTGASTALWDALSYAWQWAGKHFTAFFDSVFNNAEGGDVIGSGVRKTGRIVGQGNNTSDQVPLNAMTMGSTGEYVVRKAAVQRMEQLYGKGVMSAINMTGSIPGKYIRDARRTSRITMPQGRKTPISNGTARELRIPVKATGGTTYNQTFIYPSVTPVEVRKNQKLDQYANLGLI